MEERSSLLLDWVNKIFGEKIIYDLEDLEDGTMLVRLAEKLTKRPSRVYVPAPVTVEERVTNITEAVRLVELAFGAMHGVDIQGIANGNVTSILGFTEALKSASEADVKKTETITRNTMVKREMLRKQTMKMTSNVNFTIKSPRSRGTQNKNEMRISVARRQQISQQKSPTSVQAQTVTVAKKEPYTGMSPRTHKQLHQSLHDLSVAPELPERKYLHRREAMRRGRRAREYTTTEIEEVAIGGTANSSAKQGIRRINDQVFDVDGTYYVVTGVKGDDNEMEELKLTPMTLKEFVVACARQLLVEQWYQQQVEREDQHLDMLIERKDVIASVTLIQRYIRGHNVRRLPEVQGMITRKYTMREITSSEELYVSNLIILKDYYILPLLRYKEDAHLRNTLRDLEMIIKYNQTLLKSLLQFKEQGNVYGRGFAKQFMQFTMFLKSYTTYVVNQGEISDEIFQKSKQKSYGNKLKELTSQPQVKTQPIFSYLILPIQRIPRYELFIKQLIKNMPSHHPERGELIRSLKAVSDINRHLNESRRITENIKRVQFIASRVTTKKFDLANDSHRRYVSGGFIRILGNPTKFTTDFLAEKHYLALLFSDVILLIQATKPTKIIEDNAVDTILTTSKLKCNYILSIDKTSVISTKDTRFYMVTPDATFLVACESVSDKGRWLNMLEECLVSMYSPLVARGAEVRRQNGLKGDITGSSKAREFEKNRSIFRKPDFEGEALYRDMQTGSWEPCALVLVGSILYVFASPMDILSTAPPMKLIDVTDHLIRSPMVSSKPASFEISFRYEVHMFSVRDEETKSLWLIALRNAFTKFNVVTAVSKAEALPQLPLREPLHFLDDMSKTNDTIEFLQAQLTIPCNRVCADCLFREVSMVDLDYGVFICGPCSRSHIKLPHRHLKLIGSVPVLPIKQIVNYPVNDLIVWMNRASSH